MNIQDALKDTGKAKLGKSNGWASHQEGYTWHAERDGKFLRWFDEEGNPRCEISYFDIINIGWEPHYEKEVIRPEKAGEVWEDSCGNLWLTSNPSEKGLRFMSATGDNSWFDFPSLRWHKDVVHNQNGWTRPYPPVEDEKVERIVIEGVEWFGVHNKTYPEYYEERKDGFKFESLQNKPPMTMILEIPKER